MYTVQQSTTLWIHDTYASSNRSCGFAFIFCWTLVRSIVVLPGLSVQCIRTSSSRKLMCSFPVPYVLDSSDSMTTQHAQSNKSINSCQMTVCVEKQIWGDSKSILSSTILYVIQPRDSCWVAHSRKSYIDLTKIESGQNGYLASLTKSPFWNGSGYK